MITKRCLQEFTALAGLKKSSSQKQTFAALIAIVGPTSRTVFAFMAAHRVDTFTLAVAPTILLLALIHV